MANTLCSLCIGSLGHMVDSLIVVSFSLFEADLSDTMPVVHTSIGGGRIIGRLTAGNASGIISNENMNLGVSDKDVKRFGCLID